MIVIDSSAVVAILLDELERADFALRVASSRTVISTLNVFETETVIRGRLGAERVPAVRVWLTDNGVDIAPFDDAQSSAANDAYGRYGKGFHRAKLNICDCAAYALAKSLKAPLLYKGDDFARTDVVSAVTAG